MALGLTSSSDVEALEGFLSSNARSCHETGHFSPGTPLPSSPICSPPTSLNTFIHNPWTSLPKELSLPPHTIFLRGPGCRRPLDPCRRDPPSPPCPPGRVNSMPTHVARPESRLRGSARGPRPQTRANMLGSHALRLQEPRGESGTHIGAAAAVSPRVNPDGPTEGASGALWGGPGDCRGMHSLAPGPRGGVCTSLKTLP